MKIIEIIIGIILIYALLSILVSILAEWYSSIRKMRGRMLKQTIHQMLDDSALNMNYGYLVLNHPLLSTLNNKGENRPAQYIDSGLFAEALIDIIIEQGRNGIPIGESTNSDNGMEESTAINQFQKGLNAMNDSPLNRMLVSFLLKSNGNIESVSKKIQHWFDANMDRASGWYKRKQKKTLWFFALVVTIAFNVDSIHLIKSISTDTSLRNNLLSVAESIEVNASQLDTNQLHQLEFQILLIDSSLQTIKKVSLDSIVLKYDQNLFKFITNIDSSNKIIDSISDIKIKQVEKVIGQISALGLPIGYSNEKAPLSWRSSKNETSETKTQNKNETSDNQQESSNISSSLLLWLFGLLISIFMLSQGSSFWFDILIKFVNIRKAGIKPLSSLNAK